MTYTSGFHFAIRLGLALLGILVVISLTMMAFRATLYTGLPEGYGLIPAAVVFGICLFIYIKLTDKYQGFLDAVAAYFYIREELETKVSFQEAKALSFLFSGENSGKWYPLSEVRKLPKEERKQYLFDFAERVAPGVQHCK